MIKVQKPTLSALFLLFCLFTQNASAWCFNSSINTKNNEEYISSEHNHPTLQADSFYTDFLHSLFQSSTEPIPAPFEEENNEVNRDDDEWNKLQFNFFGDFDFVFKYDDVSFAQLEKNVLKRTKTSLVVLHHSWKSFLS